MYVTYSITHISLTDAGFRRYHWHQTMPDDRGPRGLRNVRFSSRFRFAGHLCPEVIESPRISVRAPNSSTPLADLSWWTTTCAAVFCLRISVVAPCVIPYLYRDVFVTLRQYTKKSRLCIGLHRARCSNFGLIPSSPRVAGA